MSCGTRRCRRAQDDVDRSALPPRRHAPAFAGLKRFVDYIMSKDKVWIAKRIDIAEHWIRTNPYQ
jgi:hypothetical protein